MKNYTLKLALTLGIISTLVALMLSAANSITKPIIDANSEKESAIAQAEVLPLAERFEKFDISGLGYKNPAAEVTDVSKGFDENNVFVGYVVKVTAKEGYGGDIEMMIGLDLDLRVTHIKILSMSETPGLGSKAQDDKFIKQFEQKSGEVWIVKKPASSEGEISAISGATITSKAVAKAVNAAFEITTQVSVAEPDISEMMEEESNSEHVESQIENTENESAEEVSVE